MLRYDHSTAFGPHRTQAARRCGPLVHQAAKLVAALLRVAGITAGWRKVTAAFRRVYDSRHLQADCPEPGSAPEPYARQSSMGYLYLFYRLHLPSPFITITEREQVSIQRARVPSTTSAAATRFLVDGWKQTKNPASASWTLRMTRSQRRTLQLSRSRLNRRVKMSCTLSPLYTCRDAASRSG